MVGDVLGFELILEIGKGHAEPREINAYDQGVKALLRSLPRLEHRPSIGYVDEVEVLSEGPREVRPLLGLKGDVRDAVVRVQDVEAFLR